MSEEHIISVNAVTKAFPKLRALDHVNLTVKPGTITALLGPNGAGKTTLVKILATLSTPTEGTATVVGLDVVKDAQTLRSQIGLAGQYAAVDEFLSGRENLEIVGRLYQLPRLQAKARAAELLKQFSLEEAADRTLKTYSGGMRRRLDLAASLIIQPKVLFLDEPTTGLDPRGRFGLWNVIRELVKAGTTVLLTTQYLEEADQLADNIFVIDHGKIIAEGTPDELKRKIGGEVLELHVAKHSEAQQVADLIHPLGSETPAVDQETGIVTMSTPEGTSVLIEAIRRLDAAHLGILDVTLRRPSLDDVFMKLTGQKAE